MDFIREYRRRTLEITRKVWQMKLARYMSCMMNPSLSRVRCMLEVEKEAYH